MMDLKKGWRGGAVVRVGSVLSGLMIGLASPAIADELVVLVPVGFGATVERTIAPVIKEKFGLDFVYQEANSSETFAKILAEKNAPEVSASCPAGLDFLRGVEADLWAELDMSKIPNAEQLHDFAKQEPWGKYGIAVSSGAGGLQYRTDIFEQNGWDPPTSWKDLARPEFKGHVAIASTASGNGIALLSLWSRQAGVGRGDAEPGFKFAKELVDGGQIAFFPAKSSEFNAAMDRGEIWIGTQWSEAALQAAAAGSPVGYVYPSEGTYLLPNGCTVTKNAPHQDAAHEFVNLMVSEETQTALVKDRWTHPMRKGLELPPEYDGKILLTEEDFKNVGFLDDFEMAEFKPQWHERFVKEIEAAR